MGYPYVTIYGRNNQISFFFVIDVIAANVLCLNGNRRQNVF